MIDEERFFFKVKKIPNGCWLWTGATTSNGYGNFWYNKRYLGAHRISYLFAYGKIPEGLQINHLCGNKICVNPTHLKLGDQVENMKHCVHLHHTHYTPKLKGEKHGRAKLTIEQVKCIRKEYATGKTSYPKLGRKYSVSHSQIFRIIKKENWND